MTDLVAAIIIVTSEHLSGSCNEGSRDGKDVSGDVGAYLLHELRQVWVSSLPGENNVSIFTDDVAVFGKSIDQLWCDIKDLIESGSEKLCLFIPWHPEIKCSLHLLHSVIELVFGSVKCSNTLCLF